MLLALVLSALVLGSAWLAGRAAQPPAVALSVPAAASK